MLRMSYALLPAAIASVVGGMLFSHYASRPSVAVPAAAIGTPAGAEMMQMVRDEHALIVNYLQKYAEARQKNDLAAEDEMVRSKAAEHAAMLAAPEARATELKALAIDAYAAEKPKRKVAAKQPSQELNKAGVGEPLRLVQMASVAPQIQPFVQPTMLPARLIMPAAGSDENIVKAKFREVTATIERIPLWVRSVAERLYGDVPSYRVLHLRTGIS